MGKDDSYAMCDFLMNWVYKAKMIFGVSNAFR